MNKIECCRVCNGKNIIEFLDLGKQPFANSLVVNLNERENFYPLALNWCSDCNLVQLTHTADPKDLFSNYVWITSTSKTAREYSKILYNEIISRTENLDKSYVLEVASNDGTFLLPFVQGGYNVLGVDPAENIVDIAVANGVPTKCKFFGVKAAEEITEDFGQAMVVIARNVLPHVANLHDFVKGLQMCLKDEGLLVIEFHYAMRIYKDLQYDSFYHEHLCYFTLKSIERLLNQFNLFVTDITESPISGGALVLYVKKKKEESPIVQSYRDSEKKTKLNELSGWKNFAKRVQFHRDQLLKILTKITNETGPVVGYGASARSSTLLNFCGIDTRFVSMIADQNLFKHNKYTAGTHIPIDSPEEVMKKNPEYVLILAWNFSDEIMNVLKDNYNYTGKCILPLPKNPKIMRACE